MSSKSTKTQLYEIGIALFREKGFDAVSINDICEVAHLTKGAFYHHYSSKFDILTEHHRQSLGRVLDLDRHIEPFASAREEMWFYIDRYTSFSLDLGATLLESFLKADMASSIPYLTPTIEDKPEGSVERDFLNRLLAALKKCQENGEVHDRVSADDLLWCFLSGLIGLTYHWCEREGAFDFMGNIRHLFDTVFIPLI